jgi:hypothetical protein
MPDTLSNSISGVKPSQMTQETDQIQTYSKVNNQAAHNSGPAPLTAENSSSPIELSAKELSLFISQGFLKLDTGLPLSFHQYMVAQLSESVMGNNVVPSCPELDKVYSSPKVAGAIQSILGKDYCLHSHRHLHMSPSGTDIGGWHKDSQWGYGRRQRNNRPRWAMLLYFPNELPKELGGTGIIPGLQYTHQNLQDEEQWELGQSTIGEAGTCVLMHYDTWHARYSNRSDIDRIMVKLQFFALKDPEPRSDLYDPNWALPEPISQRGMWNYIWKWYGGEPMLPIEDPTLVTSALEKLSAPTWQERNLGADQLSLCSSLGEEAILALKSTLEDHSEIVATNGAIALAHQGETGLKFLHDAFLLENPKHLQSLIQGFIVGGAASSNLILSLADHDTPEIRALACYALGEIGMNEADHLETLRQHLSQDENLKVQINAAYALGIHPFGYKCLQSLVDCLQEENDELRMFSMYGILRHIDHAQPWEDIIVRTLCDGNRYLIALAVEALHHLNTPSSLQAVISYLKVHRWCEQNGTRAGF